MSSLLFQEASRWVGLRTVWGRSDCMMVLADWVRLATGRDFAADIRGRYRSRAGAEDLAGWLSDPVAAIAVRVEPHLARIAPKDRRPGDIGVLALPDEDTGVRYTGALWLGRSWCCKADGSGATEIINAPCLAVWHVPWEGGDA